MILDGDIEIAKSILNDAGYVVVRKGRIETLGAQEFVPFWTFQSMQAEDDPIAVKNRIANKLSYLVGLELGASGFLPVTLEDTKGRPYEGVVYRTKLTIIKPRTDDRTRD